MTQEEFRRRWRAAWMMLNMDKLRILSAAGYLDRVKQDECNAGKAEALLSLPGEIDSLLDRMWADLQPKEPVKNGQPTKPMEVKR